MRSAKNRQSQSGNRASAGLTLIELLVVLAIIGLLATIAGASYKHFILKAKRTEGKAALLQLLQQQERYYSQHNSYIAFSSASIDEDERKFKWYSGTSETTSAYEIAGTACPDESIQNCVKLTAKPGTSKVDANFKDAHCGDLAVSSNGKKGAENADCWK